MTKVASSVVWFRRDLRLHDHPALTEAARSGAPVAPLFVIDPALLRGRFASANRTWFLLGAVRALSDSLAARGSHLFVRVGRATEVVPAFARDVGAGSVLVSREIGPYGRRRDRAVAAALERSGVKFRTMRGVLVHEPEEVVTGDGLGYRVFTPFLRRWEALPIEAILPVPDRIIGIEAAGGRRAVDDAVPSAADLGVGEPTAHDRHLPEPGEQAARRRLAAWLDSGPTRGPSAYAVTRDELADGGTSRLGPDLRLGLLSPVEVATRALAVDGAGPGSRRFASELAWRDFYAHILWRDPRIAHEAFQRRYVGVEWPNGTHADPSSAASDLIVAWREGQTGYPVIDAAMRQLMATGFMPNRARMIVASFLTKDLLVDWRVGEAHFMEHLLDGDPASNLGGWQWAASVGTDAQPYFRVFNPVTQAERFDPDGRYVRRWVPELAQVPTARIQAPWTMTRDEQVASGCRIGSDYPAPIVDHAEARRRAIAWHQLIRDGTAESGP